MLRGLRTYRVIPALVATFLVFGVTAPVVHLVCAATVSSLHTYEAMNSNALPAGEADEHASCVPPDDEPQPVADTTCCLIESDTDRAILPALPYIPEVKSLAASVMTADIITFAADPFPTSLGGPPHPLIPSPTQALLSVFLI